MIDHIQPIKYLLHKKEERLKENENVIIHQESQYNNIRILHFIFINNNNKLTYNDFQFNP